MEDLKGGGRMIKQVNGNVLKAKENIICHQVNCMGKMGAGLAKQIAKSKNALDVYAKYCHLHRNNRESMLGDALFTQVAEDKWVAHCFGQLNYGRDKRQTDYESLKQSLQRVKDAAQRKEKSVAIPYGIGCGLTGGDWEVVYGIIDDVFWDYEVTIYKLT